MISAFATVHARSPEGGAGGSLINLTTNPGAAPGEPWEDVLGGVTVLQQAVGPVAMNCLGCLVLYCALRQSGWGNKAWYLTLYSSAVTSVVGVYFGWMLFCHGFQEVFSMESALTRGVAWFFLAYCLMDLITGRADYRSDMEYDSGTWHHICYVFILIVLLAGGHTAIFAACLVEEIPTLYLSVTRVNRKNELPLAFACLFFTTRLVFHAVAAYAVLEVSVTFFLIALALLRQHMLWFGKWWSSHGMQAHVQMTLYKKLGLLGGMVVVQICTHVWLLTNHLARGEIRAALTTEVFHICACLYFTVELLKIVQGSYRKGFIHGAIEEWSIIYNVSWEDPAIEIEALGFNEEDVVLTISSAGCNVLDYLVEGVKHVVAADLNVAQLAMLDLKLAGIKTLTHEQFFALWGRSDNWVFEEVYHSVLRPHLRREESKEFWDKNGTSLFENNIMFAGTSGLMAKLFNITAQLTGAAALLQRRTKPAGKNKLTEKVIDACSYIVSRPWLNSWLAPLGGIPDQQLALMSSRPDKVLARFKEIVQTRMWQADNYFYYGYLVGVFSQDCCPRYMSKEHFHKLQDRIDRVTLCHGTFADAAKLRNDFTVLSLLDAMDWMPTEVIADTLAQLIPQVNRPKCRIFWRSLADYVHSPVLAHLEVKEVEIYDRVGWYLSQWVATVPEHYNPTALAAKPQTQVLSNTLLQDAKVAAILVAYGISSKEKDAAKFYAAQGELYDGFRESMLKDRDTLLRWAVPWTQPIKTWVSVGCGTARDVEFVVEQAKQWNTKIFLCDLSPALLKMARARVDRLGLQAQTTFVEGDITKPEIQRLLPSEGCDLVTCSYCVTMIPDWLAALQSMKSMLRVGGLVGIVDFTSRAEDGRAERFLRWWFAHDGVWFNRGHLEWLQKNFATAWVEEGSNRMPYTPLRPAHYVFVGRRES